MTVIKEFPCLEAALGTIMFRVMSEGLTTDAPDDRAEKVEAVRQALIAMWPDELKASGERTRWRTLPEGGSQAMFDYGSDDDVIRIAFETSQTMAQGYRDALTSFSDQTARDKAEAAATAAHNTGVFILQALGLTMEEIRNLTNRG